MANCIVRGCTSKYRKKDRSVIMHSFPVQKERIRTWLIQIGQFQDNLDFMVEKVHIGKIYDTYRLCSLHFAADAYRYAENRRMLKRDAVPTIFQSSVVVQVVSSQTDLPTTTSTAGSASWSQTVHSVCGTSTTTSLTYAPALSSSTVSVSSLSSTICSVLPSTCCTSSTMSSSESQTHLFKKLKNSHHRTVLNEDDPSEASCSSISVTMGSDSKTSKSDIIGVVTTPESKSPLQVHSFAVKTERLFLQRNVATQTEFKKCHKKIMCRLIERPSSEPDLEATFSLLNPEDFLFISPAHSVDGQDERETDEANTEWATVSDRMNINEHMMDIVGPTEIATTGTSTSTPMKKKDLSTQRKCKITQRKNRNVEIETAGQIQQLASTDKPTTLTGSFQSTSAEEDPNGQTFYILVSVDPEDEDTDEFELLESSNTDHAQDFRGTEETEDVNNLYKGVTVGERTETLVDYRKEEMWNDGRYEYERLPRLRLPPREGPPEGDYHRVVSVVRRPDDEGYPRYDNHSDPDFRDYDDPHVYERRSGPYRVEDPGYRWGRGEPPMSRHLDYRESREGFRRKPLYPPAYMRDRSPPRRESPFYRESPVTRKDSPHSRSGSSVSSRSYSPERAKFQSRSKERPGPHGLRSSKDASPSSSVGIPSKTVEIDKGSRLVESTFIEVASKWVSEKMDKVSESNLTDATEELVKAGTSYALYADQTADPEASISVNPELYETSPLGNRSKAIAAKTKEIEEVYRQDCETFGMVVKMLIDKDPSLEKQIQFALRQNLSEIGERCIEELKLYIAEYDAAHQDLA